MKIIGKCKIGETELDIVDDKGVHRFRKDPLTQAIYDSGLNLNKLHSAFFEAEGSISLESYLVFCAKSGYSHSGLLDVESSMVGMNPRHFPVTYFKENGELKDVVLIGPIQFEAYKK